MIGRLGQHALKTGKCASARQYSPLQFQAGVHYITGQTLELIELVCLHFFLVIKLQKCEYTDHSF